MLEIEKTRKNNVNDHQIGTKEGIIIMGVGIGLCFICAIVWIITETVHHSDISVNQTDKSTSTKYIYRPHRVVVGLAITSACVLFIFLPCIGCLATLKYNCITKNKEGWYSLWKGSKNACYGGCQSLCTCICILNG